MTRSRPASDDPRLRIGPWVPQWSIRVAVAAVGALLFVVAVPGPVVGVGVLLSLLAGALPRTRAAWGAIVLLAVGEGLRGQSAIGVPLFVLILGVHVLHVLGAYSTLLPLAGRLQLAALVRPLRGIVLVQVPVQALALVLLLATGGVRPSPAAAVLGAVALLATIGAFWWALRDSGAE
jgi:hypothetical protein